MPNESQQNSVKMCLALIELRQKSYESERAEAVAQRRWSQAGGLQCLEAGLLMAANILREKMQEHPQVIQAQKHKLLNDCLGAIEQRQQTYDSLRDAAIMNQQWNEAGMMESTGTGLLMAAIVLREELK